jgi:squalene-associated FAD-dependent desaturase
MRIAIIGAGWAGLTGAVALHQQGHVATVFEASRQLGGRARAVASQLPDGSPILLDNGQHIMIGAYTETLRLMRQLGLDPDALLLRLPLTLQFPDGLGLRLPRWPTPLDALAGIAVTRGWGLADKISLLRAAVGWQWAGFRCARATSVAQLCQDLSPRVLRELIEPLCVSALNTPATRASGQVFLRVLRDSLFGVRGGSNLLLPKVDLTTLLPQAAAQWLQQRGGQVRLGERVEQLRATDATSSAVWRVNGEDFDRVVLATSAADALHLLDQAEPHLPPAVVWAAAPWRALTRALRFEAIATTYAFAPGARLAQPMLALRSSDDPAQHAPAQFVFDRGQLGGPAGLLAFVVSASQGDRASLQADVTQQASAQLGLAVQPLQTIVEKRATFACTPGLLRPLSRIAPGLLACGDYVDGPYPATLEGAVRSALRLAIT